MASITLNAYTIEFARPHARDSFLNHRNPTDESQFNAWRRLGDYFRDCAGQHIDLSEIDPVNPARSKLAYMTVIADSIQSNEDEASHCGLIECGSAGESRRVVDRTNGNQVFRQRPRHAGLAQFFFKIWCPDNCANSLLVTEVRGTRGCKTSLVKHLKQVLLPDDIGVRVGTVTNTRLLREYFGAGSTPKKLLVTAKKRDNDRNEFLQQTMIGGRPLRLQSEVTIELKGHETLNPRKRLLRGLFSGATPVSDVLSIYGFDEPDDVLVEMQLDNGKQRTFRYTKGGESPFGYDITDLVTIDQRTGFAAFTDLNARADEIYAELEGEVF